MKTFHVGIKGVIRRDDGAVLLLMKNSENAFWEVPGGRMDDEESIDETLLRELSEELPGISKVENKGIICAHRLPKDIKPELSLMLIYFEVRASLPDPIRLSEEHKDFKWVKSVHDVLLDGGTLKALSIIFGQQD